MTQDHLNESFTQAVEGLTWSIEKAKKFVDMFDKTVGNAIELRGKNVAFDHKQNPLKCIDSFVDLTPSGNEKGNYYAIDLGGTNLRAVCVTLSGHGKTSTQQLERNIRDTGVTDHTPKGILDKHTPACVMFDQIAELTKEVMRKVGDNPKDKRNVAFTFSFPLIQHSLANGELVCWTKEFETGMATNDPVESQDVSELLNAAFRRRGMGTFVGAVANDTVGTLLSAGYEHNASLPPCRVGIILGTGFNIASYDPSAQQNNYMGSIINHECGNYNGVEEFSTIMDMELDYSTNDCGKQLAEKMISGAYLGELCRLTFLKVFKFRLPQGCWDEWSFQTPDAAEIYADNTKQYKVTQRVLKTKLGWDLQDIDQLRMVYKIACVIFDRSATISALMTSVLAHRTRHLQKALGGVTVGVDGSLYLKNPKYKKTYRKTIDKILGCRSELLHMVAANDGSGKGAAVISACLDS